MTRRLLVGTTLLVLAASAVHLALHEAFSLDEFQYLHAGWLMSRGQVPYRDFFEVHLPLVYQVLSPLYWLSGDGPGALVWQRAGMLAFLALAGLSAAQLGRRAGWVAAWLAPVLLLASPGYVRFATEVRPDPAAFALFLASVAALTLPGSARLRGVLCGGLVVLAVWGSQKVLFYGAVVLVAPLLGLLRRGGPARVTPAGFLLGAALAALPVAVWLTAEQAWGPLWRWCFTWAAWHQRNYPAFSAWKYLGPALREQPWLVALALAGAVGTARAVWRQRRAPSAGGADVVLLLALPMTLLSYALQRAPMPYSLVPFFGVCAVLAARALAALAEALPRPARVVGALAAVPLALAQAWALAPAPEDTAAHQLATLARLQALTAPEDCVYDNAGSAVTRPHAHFYFYTDGLIRWRDAAMLEREVPEALLARGCPARLVDVRSDSLPAGLQRFLARHYQPLDGDLALWGQRLSPGVDDTFLAVVEGAYFVTPAAALEHGRLRVDGQEVHAPVLTLTRGPHSVRLEGGGASPVYLLWLPRTGERWSPRRDLPPRFSRLF